MGVKGLQIDLESKIKNLQQSINNLDKFSECKTANDELEIL